ncbi:hypothetical protein NXC14_CH00652 [Rhizobium sp. NXC14]|uniref:hypothetical protein n=1 Tax=Rhizobium sp. NXC14 TaxID=1981173 RepID=UPI000A20BF1E|nr:hypothetical protein [Rhizobium sp. NXC14]ARO28654.1 hypothetical protein NXC14_CH00652 [Rhizobium sp. NXC14]
MPGKKLLQHSINASAEPVFTTGDDRQEKPLISYVSKLSEEMDTGSTRYGGTASCLLGTTTSSHSDV